MSTPWPDLFSLPSTLFYGSLALQCAGIMLVLESRWIKDARVGTPARRTAYALCMAGALPMLFFAADRSDPTLFLGQIFFTGLLALEFFL